MVDCRGRSWKAHSTVLAVGSEVLKACCEEALAFTRRIDLSQEQPELVKYLIDYLYTEDYTVASDYQRQAMRQQAGLPKPPWRLDPELATVHMGMCSIGKRYRVPQLDIEATKRFRYSLGLWEKDGGTQLPKIKSLVDFAYSGGPEIQHLRQLIVKHLSDQDCLSHGWKVKEFEGLLVKYPKFAFEVVRWLGSRLGTREETEPPIERTRNPGTSLDGAYLYMGNYRCDDCKKVFRACLGAEGSIEMRCPLCECTFMLEDFPPMYDCEGIELAYPNAPEDAGRWN